MAVLTGATILSASHSYGSRVTTDLDDLTAEWSPTHSALIGGSGYGTLTDVNAAANGRSLTGYKARSYVDDFYYRIHIIPGRIDVGSLIGDSVRNITLWNAHFSVKSYTGLTATGTDGITFTPPVAPPYNFAALEEQVFQFTIRIDGPPTIGARYTWAVGGEYVDLQIVGERTVPFAFPPDWSTSVTERLSFLTDVMVSRDGSEQRVALRSKPRRSFEYRFNAFGREWVRLQNALWGWHRYAFSTPIWTDVSELEADAPAGSSSLQLDTSNRGFAVGGQALIYSDANLFEVVSISGVTSSTVTLERETQKAWSRLSRVYPAAISHLPNSVPVQKLTDNVVTGAVTLNLDPVRTDPRLPVVAAAVTHDGYEVMLREPNWSAELDNSSEQDFGLLDNQTGATNYVVTQSFARTMRGMRWLLEGRAEIDDFRALLRRLNGRQKAVYIPTFSTDMTLLDAASSGASVIKVDCPKLAAFVGVNEAYRHIVIEMTTGILGYYQITSLTEDDDGAQLVGLSPSLSTSIVPGNVRRISFMPLFRLASDDVVINWITNTVATCEATFTLVTE